MPKGIGIMAAYIGGSKIAVGTIHTELKSLVSPPPLVYAIRGVDALEIIPHDARSTNVSSSSGVQVVCLAE
jgi:hypothetical protein